MDFRPSQEHVMFREAVARFAQEELTRHVKPMEATDKFPVEVFPSLGQMGFLGAHFPEELGGAGADFTSFCIFIEEVGRVSAAIAVNVLLHTLMGAAPIFLAGSEEQKRAHFAP